MNEFGIVSPTPPAVELEHPDDGTHTTTTAVVLGVPFGGTSMLAVLVDALGVPIIRDASFPFAYEADEFNNRSLGDVRHSIERYNAQYPVWGFKDPHAGRHPAEDFHAAMRNPHYLIVAKDLATMTFRAIANPVVEDGSPPLKRMQNRAHTQAQFYGWILGLPPAPKLLVSYHRGIREPLELCRIVAAFLHVTPTEAQLQRAVARVSPRGGYLTKEHWPDGT